MGLRQWFDRKFVAGYYYRHYTYKNLPRWREICFLRFNQGYSWRESIKGRWVVRDE